MLISVVSLRLFSLGTDVKRIRYKDVSDKMTDLCNKRRGAVARLASFGVCLVALCLGDAMNARAQNYDGGEELYSTDAYDGQYAEEDAYGAIPDFNSPHSLYSRREEANYGYVGSMARLDESDAAQRYQASRYALGSAEYLDATSADLFSQNLVDYGYDANSGNGKRAKKVRSTGLFGMPVENDARDGDTFYERWVEPDVPSEGWTKQVLPVGLMYPSYLASRKDPRLQSIITYERDYGTLWDITLGGRAPIFRYGTSDVVQPEGWEIELEGAALLRLDWERKRQLAGTDYRAGLPIVYGTKRWQFKTGYYHVSSHLGDNYLLDHFRTRKHYVRDSILFGIAFKPVRDVRLYAELDYAFHYDRKNTDPIELQFGFEYSPQFDPHSSNWSARPFLASHGHLYQERKYGGYWTTQTGVQWRSPTNSVLRLGAEFFMGGDELYQFHTKYQRKIGGGIWYDF